MPLSRFFVKCLIISLLAACAAPPRQPEQVVSRPSGQISPAKVQSDVDYLQKAEQVFATSGSELQRNEWLIKAADTYQQRGDYAAAIRLIQILLPELDDNRQQNIASLILSECLLALDTPQTNEQAQTLVSRLQTVKDYEQRLYLVQARVFSQQQMWIKASLALQLTHQDEQQKSQQIWDWLQQLDTKALQQAQRRQASLKPWLELSLILRTYGLDNTQFAQQVLNWQQRNASHPLSRTLPEEITDTLQQHPLKADKIAVLLPLSGRLASQGLALKEGILAAYLADLSDKQPAKPFAGESVNTASQITPTTPGYRQLRFFDSNLKSPQELLQLVADYDFVLGPLLKENISGLVDILPADKVMLALNRTDNELNPARAKPESGSSKAPDNLLPPAKEHYFYALAPEDEAQQLAQYIKQKGFKHPIIFTADNSVTNRMAEAFVSTWQAGATPVKNPDIAVFSDSKDMREQVEGLLDVAQSKRRINQMENVADIEVFAENRNRQDIDVIVLFANPEQTELLNPIIEASLNPSENHHLAVFASSRSYSLELSKNSLRDLRNLTFSDMPWMLPGHEWPALANEISELWPQRQDSLLRLFAMGYDSYKLIANLRQLKAMPQLAKRGLTGELTIDANGVLHRHLPLAQVTQDRVSVIAVD